MTDLLEVLKQGHRDVENDLEVALRHYEREIRMWMVDHGVPIPDGDGSEGPTALQTKMRKAVAVARGEWERIVTEPPGQGWERIDHYIRSPEGSGWSWLDPYKRDGQTAWCGHFLSFVWRAIGVKGDIVHKHTPSTYRLWKWAKDTKRVVPLDAIRQGDAVVVGPAVDSPYGAHITIAAKGPKDGFVETFEGNAKGTFPDGGYREGVVQQRRPFAANDSKTYRVRFAYRPLKEDFDE